MASSDFNPEKLSFKIEPGALADIFLAIQICPVEISGFGKVIRDGDVFVVQDDIVILKQACSLTSTNIDLLSHAQWHTTMSRSGRKKEVGDFRLWWHSHVHSGAYFSGTDKDNINRSNTGFEEWLMSFVGNKFGEFEMRLDIFKPERLSPTLVPRLGFTEPKDSASFLLFI